MPTPRKGFNPSYCPSCERYIGSSRACPYCDCDAYVPSALRVLRITALGLAGLGLLLLYVYSVRRPVPNADINKLIPMMNYAAVHLTGTVASKTYTGQSPGGKTDYLAFSMQGESGRSVRVQAYGTVAGELDSAPIRPTPGVQARATGQLQVAPDGTARLRLRRPEDLKLDRPAESGP